MFGINGLSQPDLTQAPLVPPCLACTQVTVPMVTEKLQTLEGRLHQTCFVQPIILLNQTLETLKPKDRQKDKEKEVETMGCDVIHFFFLSRADI